jgi:hypothetical protein
MSSRGYLRSDLEILWGLAAARCAFPGCRRELVKDETARDPKKVIGNVCHIVAHSAGGPRADATVTEEERRRESNLILLCATHHDVVDAQPNTFTVDDLRCWKREHIEWVHRRLVSASVSIDFGELQRLLTSLLAQVAPAAAEVSPPTPPPEKLRKNDLTIAVASRLRIGSLRFGDVEQFVARTTQADPGYGVRLREGFQVQYQRFEDSGLSGDPLFEAIVDWAAGASSDFDTVATSLAVVTYLFTICDLFEP